MTRGLQSASPFNSEYQKTSAVTEPTPEDSTCFSVLCVLAFKHKLVPVCHFIVSELNDIYWLCISWSFILAGRQIMRQQLHCCHQITQFNKRYMQSADPVSSIVYLHLFCCVPAEVKANLRQVHLKNVYSKHI